MVETVRDVLGEPESWPHYGLDSDRKRADGTLPTKADMSDAIITAVNVHGNTLSISTSCARCGITSSVFFIDDPDLRRRLVRVLTVGMRVDQAVAASI